MFLSPLFFLKTQQKQNGTGCEGISFTGLQAWKSPGLFGTPWLCSDKVDRQTARHVLQPRCASVSSPIC